MVIASIATLIKSLKHFQQETRGETGGTKLWRRISMINVSSSRKLDNQVDVLGHTTWGIRKVITGSGSGSVGGAVASDTTDLQFESIHWQILFTINWIKKRDRKD